MAPLHQGISQWNQWLWADNATSKPMLVVRHCLQILCALIADLKAGQLSLRAMSLVYTTILSLVPLLAISFSVLKGLGAHNQIQPFLYNLLEPLGDKKIDVTAKIIGFVDNIQVGVLGALGIILLLYTVVGMLQKIEHAFNYAWRIEQARNLSKRLNDYLSVLLVGPFLILLSSAMTTAMRSDNISEKLAFLPVDNVIIALVGVVLPYVILSFAFTFFYAFIPNTKVNFKAAIIGGLITALMWKLMGWGVSSFIANSSSKTAIYSAFASVLVFMVWLYLVWLVLLIGASISYYIQHPLSRNDVVSAAQKDGYDREALALRIMAHIAKHFEQGETMPIDAIATHVKQPIRQVEPLLTKLKGATLLVEENDHRGWLLAKPATLISYYDILCAVRKTEGQRRHKYTAEIDQVLEKSFSDVTLESLYKTNG